MKKEKLRHYANVISRHADSPYVTLFFFLGFLVDSWVVVIPTDSLLAASIALRPQHMKKWLTAACLGFGGGLGLLALLVNTQLQPLLFQYFHEVGYLHRVMDVVAHAQDYGYIEIAIAVFTIFPSMLGVLVGVVVGLNPWIVWAISFGGKLLKIALTVYVIFSSSKLVKKILRYYVKTSF